MDFALFTVIRLGVTVVWYIDVASKLQFLLMIRQLQGIASIVNVGIGKLLLLPFANCCEW